MLHVPKTSIFACFEIHNAAAVVAEEISTDQETLAGLAAAICSTAASISAEKVESVELLTAADVFEVAMRPV